jgi:hypothetical protein
MGSPIPGLPDVNSGLDAELIRLGVTGAFRTAPLATAMPASMVPFPVGWINLGYISDDGITEARSEDRQEFVPWQSLSAVRSEVTTSQKTFQLTLWESNWDTVSLYYNVGIDDVTIDSTGDIDVVIFDEQGKPKQDLRRFGVDVVDGVYARRVLLPYGEVTERGDIVYKSDTLIGYECTVTAYVGPDGVSVRRMFMEGWAPPAP